MTLKGVPSNGARRPASILLCPSPQPPSRRTQPVRSARAPMRCTCTPKTTRAPTPSTRWRSLRSWTLSGRPYPERRSGVTTGAWALPDPRERVAVIGGLADAADFASVNWHEPGAQDVAEALLDRGVDVEAGLWCPADVEAGVAWAHHDRCLRVLLEVVVDHPPQQAVAVAGRLVAALGEVSAETSSCCTGRVRRAGPCWPKRCAGVSTCGPGWRTCSCCPTAVRPRTTHSWSHGAPPARSGLTSRAPP